MKHLKPCQGPGRTVWGLLLQVISLNNSKSLVTVEPQHGAAAKDSLAWHAKCQPIAIPLTRTLNVSCALGLNIQ